MPRGRKAWARFGAPAAFLLAATIAILLVRAGLSGSGSTTTAPGTTTRPPISSTPSTTRTPTETTAKPTRFYTLQPGDTLASVAVRFGTSAETLIELNPGIEPTALRVGQRIRVG